MSPWVIPVTGSALTRTPQTSRIVAKESHLGRRFLCPPLDAVGWEPGRPILSTGIRWSMVAPVSVSMVPISPRPSIMIAVSGMAESIEDRRRCRWDN